MALRYQGMNIYFVVAASKNMNTIWKSASLELSMKLKY